MTHFASDGSNQAPLVATGTPVPGTDAQTYMASDGSRQEALPVQGAGDAGGGPVAWDDVTGKPATFPPTIGTTSTTAKAGNYVPEWGEVTSKPAVIAAGSTAAEAIAAIGAIPTSQKGQANGVAPLDSAGLVPLEHLNVSGLTFKGAWNPVTNTPTLTDGTGSTGDFYKASADGTFNFGNGNHTFVEGDWVMFAAGVWQRLGSKETVASVNGKMGVVSLTAADVGARPSSYVPSWTEVTSKPTTFAPIIGTTATTAKAGNYAPTWAEVTSKPTTFAPIIGTTATTAKAGNYVPAWNEITGKPAVRGTVGHAVPAAYSWFVGDIPVPTSTNTSIPWTNSAYDPFSMLANGEFTLPSWAAYARVTASIQFSANATGYRYVGYSRNGVVQAAARQVPIAGDPSIIHLISPIRPMAAGSVLSLGVWQNSGAALLLNPQSWVQIELFAAQ